jgi:hypothetical protein
MYFFTRKLGIKASVGIAALIGTTLSLALLPGLIPAAFAHECTAPSTSPSNDPNIQCVYTGFMTGGGRFNPDINAAPYPNPTYPILVHGFILYCDPTQNPNNLEVNWKDPVTGQEHRFHLTDLKTAHCEMNPALGSPNPPKADFNTWVGSGEGRLDGIDGAKMYAIFTDQSQPAGTQAGGPGDWSTIVIYDKDGKLVLNVTDPLFGGAQQAHMCKGNC